jgi:hypothetical protein
MYARKHNVRQRSGNRPATVVSPQKKNGAKNSRRFEK